MNKSALHVLAILALVIAGPATADVWDTAGESDNDSNTDNELMHGSEQVHDMSVQAGPVPDQDWYRITTPAQSSFEVVMDGTTGDLNVSFDEAQLDRLDASTSAVIQDHSCIGTACFSKRLAWRNTTAAQVLDNIRVSNAGCTTACTTADQYRIRAQETTVGVARFNNAGSQITVLMSQNVSDVTINAHYFYWATNGTLLQTGTLTLTPHQLNVFLTTNFPPLVGVGGSITIAHDGPYGGLNVKSVALEPSTGFSFDTPGTYKGY
jgi:hypothetical protein